MDARVEAERLDGNAHRLHDAVADIRRHLDVAEHVLAHEAQFTQDVPVVDTVSETDLLKQVNAHLDSKPSTPAVAQGAPAQPTE